MARTELTLNFVTTAGIVDPTGITSLTQASGAQFQNDGAVNLRVVNGGSNANAVCTITLGAATPASGTYDLYIDVRGQVYLAANIAYGALKATIAADVLAAKNTQTGNALSDDFPAATCVGAGTDLPTGPVTLTFGGAGVTGLAATPLEVSIDNKNVGSGTYAAAMSTAGTGTCLLTFENNNSSLKNAVEFCPVGTYWFGPFAPGTFNQIGTGEVNLDFDSQAANLTITAFKSA